MRLFALLLPLILATSHAHGAMRSVRQVVATAPAACAYATDNGCAAANTNGSFKDATLLTSAQQSGQNSLLPTHPMTFNIPGVDYGIGPDKTLTPKDPRTINDGICAYSAGVVTCFASGTAVTENLDNYDFGGHKIGQATVTLYAAFSTSTPSHFTVTNSYFDTPASGTAFGFQANVNITFNNNQTDGTNATLSSDQPFRDDGLTFGTTFDAEYNAFTNTNVSRIYGNGANSGVAQTFKYNFIEGMNGLNTGDHGEVSLISCGGGGGTQCANKTIDHFDAEGNFIINDTYTDAYCTSGGGAGGCINSAQWFLSAGAPHQISYTTVTVSNNVQVTNTTGAPGGGPATPTTSHIWGEALFAVGWANVGNFTASGNWIDATGSALCSVNGPANGGNSVTASTSGNTITVTAVSGSYGSNAMENGWLIDHAGFTRAFITANTHGAGPTGTYTFDGPPQTLGSDSNWTMVPGFSSATFASNYSLADPLNTGVPTALNITAPLMTPANCPGSHN